MELRDYCRGWRLSPDVRRKRTPVMRSRGRRFAMSALFLGAVGLASGQGQAPSSAPSVLPPSPPPACANPLTVLQGPILSTAPMANSLPAEQAGGGDQPPPINLVTALRLADARPLAIAPAEAGGRQAAAPPPRGHVPRPPKVCL